MAKRIVLMTLFAFVVFICIVASIFNPNFWPQLWDHLYNDFWPIDSSRIMPNILASIVQWVVIGVVATVFYPPFRQWVERELDHLHAKIDHVIKHNPNITDLPLKMKGRSWSTLKQNNERK